MAKRLAAKTGTYQKDGESKNRYSSIGVIMNGSNGEYMLLDPSINLAGLLIQQNAMSTEVRTSVMVSIFDDAQQGGQPQQTQQQPQQGQQHQAPPQQQQQGQQQNAGGAQQAAVDSFDQEIPFFQYERNSIV